MGPAHIVDCFREEVDSIRLSASVQEREGLVLGREVKIHRASQSNLPLQATIDGVWHCIPHRRHG